MKKWTLEKKLFVAGLFVPPAFVLLWKMNSFVSSFIPEFLKGCMWDKWFGIYCLGCGGTRAVVSLLNGHPLRSLWYHPVVLYAAVLYLAYMGSHVLSLLSGNRFRGMRFRAWYLYGAIFIMVLNCILKNILRYAFGILLV